MTSGGTGLENIIVNKMRNRPLAKAAPIAAVRDALKGAGMAGARYPSTSPVIADTGKVSRKDAVVHQCNESVVDPTRDGDSNHPHRKRDQRRPQQKKHHGSFH